MNEFLSNAEIGPWISVSHPKESGSGFTRRVGSTRSVRRKREQILLPNPSVALVCLDLVYMPDIQHGLF